MVGAVDGLVDRQRPFEQRQRRSRLGVLAQVGSGPVTQPGQTIDRGVGVGVPKHSGDMRQVDPPHRPGIRVPLDAGGQDAAQQPHQGPGPRDADLAAHGPAGRGLHQPVHVHRVLITTGEAVPDQRADRAQPLRPVTDRVLQRPVVEPARIREQTQEDLLRVAQRPQFQQFHRGRALAAQMPHRQVPQRRDGDPRPVGDIPVGEHVTELIGEEIGVLLRWGVGLVEIAGGLLDRQRQIPQQGADPIRSRRFQPREPVGQHPHRLDPRQQRHGDRCPESGKTPPPRRHQ